MQFKLAHLTTPISNGSAIRICRIENRLEKVLCKYCTGLKLIKVSQRLSVKAGINFSVPLGRWDASGRRDTARAKTIKLTQDRELTKRQVLLEVDDAWSAIQAAVDRFRATDAEVLLAKQLETGERKRFAAGDSTLFLVNQRERATAEALGRLIDIQLEYQQALLALDAASIAL